MKDTTNRPESGKAYSLSNLISGKTGVSSWADAQVVTNAFPVGARVEHAGNRWHGRRTGTVVDESGTYGQQVIFDDLSTELANMTRRELREDSHEWTLLNEPCATAEQIAALRSRLEAKRADDERARQQSERDHAAEVERLTNELRAANPWAVAQSEQLSSYARAAKNLKAELSRAFPGVKFSVRSESYSGGNAVRVSWELGPTGAEVDAIAGKYQAGSFDGMEDIYNYDRSAYGDACGRLFGRAKYVTTSRQIGDELFERVARDMAALKGVEFTELWQRPDGDSFDWRDYVHRAFGRASLPVGWEYAGVRWSDELIAGGCAAGDIFSLIIPQVETPAPQTGDGYTLTTERGWTWIKFAAKPSADVLQDLKSHGARWSRKRGAWYVRREVSAGELGLTEAGRAPVSGISEVAETGSGEAKAEPTNNATGEGARPEVVTCESCGREFEDQDFLAAHRMIAHELAQPFAKVFKAVADARGYVETDERPDAATLRALEDGAAREAKDRARMTHPHKPGDGWHYLPGKPDLLFNGSKWFYSYPSSEGAVLAHAEDICRAIGADETFAEVHREAYPGEDVYQVTAEDRADCARPATAADFSAVCADLESINYHSFRAAFIRMAERQPDPTPDPTGTDGGGSEQSETKAEGAAAAAPRLRIVRRVQDADGARCRDCDAVFTDFYPWHWRKSQAAHERGTGHKCDLVSILAPQSPIIIRHESEQPAETVEAPQAEEQSAPRLYASADTLKALAVINDAAHVEMARDGLSYPGQKHKAVLQFGAASGVFNVSRLAKWVSLLPKGTGRIEVEIEAGADRLLSVTLTHGGSMIKFVEVGPLPFGSSPIELTLTDSGELTAPALPDAQSVKQARADLAQARKALRAESARQRAADQVHAARADVRRCEQYAEKLEAEAREAIERAGELTPEQCDEAVALAKRVRDLRRLQREVERAAGDPQQRTAEQFAWFDAFRAAEYAGAISEVEKFGRRGWHKKAETSRKRAAGILRSEFRRHTAAEVAEIAERVSPGYAEEYPEMAEYRAREIVCGQLSRHFRSPVQQIKCRLRELPREIEDARARVAHAREAERETLEAYAPHVRENEREAYERLMGRNVEANGQAVSLSLAA